MFIEVAPVLPLRQTFYYSAGSFEKEIEVGKRVTVPFGRRKITGFIISSGRIKNGLNKLSPYITTEEIKPILSVIDKRPPLSPNMLKLAFWLSDYYYAPLGKTLSSFLTPAPEKEITLPSFFEQKEMEELKRISLTGEQERAVDKIKELINQEISSVFLLKGVTGSGKTEIYFQTTAHLIRKGKSAILLLPEVSSTFQISAFAKERFGKRVGILHSRLSRKDRHLVWKKIEEGRVDLVIGTRSAIFAPLPNLGLIIVDEEFAASYKEERTPRYNARDVAIKRAEIEKGVAILGSATPSLESQYRAEKGEFFSFNLRERVSGKLPEVYIVNRWKRKKEKSSLISSELASLMEERILKREQIILFLNRRTGPSHLFCSECGWTFSCPVCKLSLLYHPKKKKLICHYCNFQKEIPEFCPSCKGESLKRVSSGIKRVKEEVEQIFPEVSIQSFDSSSISKRGAAEKILRDFSSNKINILIGTEILAKVLHFPMVTLVGIIDSDILLSLPDFRSGERTFQLLVQIAGRAGRGKIPGEVIIQTYLPDHYIIQTARKQDYTQFYKKEIAFRKELNYPPFSHLINIILSGKREKEVEKKIKRLAEILNQKKKGETEVIGPSQCFHKRIRGSYRFHLLLKGKNILEMNKVLTQIPSEFTESPKTVIDIDPYNFL